MWVTDGSVAAAERHRLVQRFQTGAKVRVALLSMTAAGQGLTLTAAKQVSVGRAGRTQGSIT